MIDDASDANHGGEILRRADDRDDRHVRITRQHTKRIDHVHGLDGARADHHDDTSALMLADGRNCNRPDRRKAGAASDEHEPVQGRRTQERQAEWALDRYPMAFANVAAEGGRYPAAPNTPYLKMQKFPRREIRHRSGWVVAARWIAPKPHPQILPREIVDRLRGLDNDFDNIRRTLLNCPHVPCARLDFRQALDLEPQVRHDPALARPRGAQLSAFATDGQSVEDAHAAGTAMPRATIIRKVDSACQCGVE